MRREVGEALAEYGTANPDVVVLDCDVSISTQTVLFRRAHPDRFFNLGIAEAGMIDMAAGLALGGKIPFASAFAAMLCYRGLEQIRTCVAYNEANVKLLAGYAGISDYKDGPTHHSLFDLAVMRAVPNMTVVAPADGNEAKAMVRAIGERPGPTYMRVSRDDVPTLFGGDVAVEIGKGRLMAEGGDLTILAIGTVLGAAVAAGAELSAEGVSARIVEIHTLKPLDAALIIRCARETGALVTVEEHSVIGGLHGAVCEAVGRERPVPVAAVGIPDRFQRTAPDVDALMRYCRLTPDAVAEAAREVLAAKRGER